jgi:hypothetical protein
MTEQTNAVLEQLRERDRQFLNEHLNALAQPRKEKSLRGLWITAAVLWAIAAVFSVWWLR